MQDHTVKNKMNQHARHFRLVSRMEAFQQKRKTYDQLDYLAFYDPPTKEAILNSMQNPVPQPLPPLGATTISFYRRSSQPVFMTRNPTSNELEGHLTYQSLWILSSLDQKLFQDYPSIVKEFQRDLGMYLSAKSNDIREMAIVAAGNKIIGKQADILQIVEQDSRQLWVLDNHIQEHKIQAVKIFPFLLQLNQFAFKSIFELTLLSEAIAQDMLDNDKVLECVVAATTNANENIRKYAIRILGNLVASKDEFYAMVSKYPLLDCLLANLSCSNGQVRKDACWLLSNFSTKKSTATQIIQHTQLIAKLVELFAYETLPHLKRELTYIFCYLAHYADRKEAFNLLGHPNVIQICSGQLEGDQNEQEVVTLQLLREMIELGDNFTMNQGGNRMLRMIKGASGLQAEIQKKSYSENAEVSGISLEILGELEQYDD